MKDKHNQSHQSHCHCDVCRDGKAAYHTWEAKQMATDGYLYHAVFDDDPTTPASLDVHTHGLAENFQHPDLQIVGPLPQEAAVMLLGAVVLRIKAGERFQAGDRVVLFDDIEAVLVEAVESGRPVLRVVLDAEDDEDQPHDGDAEDDLESTSGNLIERN